MSKTLEKDLQEDKKMGHGVSEILPKKKSMYQSLLSNPS